jgi:hypothetical protein
MRQLHGISKLQDVNDYFMNNYGITTPQSIEWNHGPVVADNGVAWNVIKTALGYSSQQMYALMTAANELSA